MHVSDCFRPRLAVLPLLLAPLPLLAQSTLPAVTVTGRVDSAPAFDLPASLDSVRLEPAPHSLVQALSGIPGLVVRDRQNLAQDLQLSIRGFGARSTFGVRGIRLYSDGVPATQPDGQGQLSHVLLEEVERIEVMRGPFSALYGNASSGVVQLWSPDGQGPASLSGRASVASHGRLAASARLSGGWDGDAGGYQLGLSWLDSEGARRHSAAQRRSLQAKLHHHLPGGGRLDLLASHFHAPDAQDPLGLNAAQYRADPRQASPQALQYDTRKSVRQDQLGLAWRQPLGALELKLSAHAGQRAVRQYLAVPVAAQASPLSAGGVIDLDGRHAGLDLRLGWQSADGSLEVSAGLEAARQDQGRRGFENYIDGGQVLGRPGALRRDELNRVDNLDPYVQAWWRINPRWALQAGARHSRVRFLARDRYVTAANPDDSGRITHARTSPVAGLVFAPGPDLRLYLAAGAGFETPTFNELGYRADGGAGLALDLRPARSQHLELGGKWRRGPHRLQAALFRIDTDDELAVARNSGGRSSYHNIGSSRRQGLELGAGLELGGGWSAELAGTWLDAHFASGFSLCAGTCTGPGTAVDAGTPLPGVPRHHGRLQLAWEGGPWQATAELQGVSRVSVDDPGGAHAPGYGLFNLELSRHLGPDRAGPLRLFARLDNALDRTHVGSVIVNEANGRYYEPGAGRSLLLGLAWKR